MKMSKRRSLLTGKFGDSTGKFGDSDKSPIDRCVQSLFLKKTYPICARFNMPAKKFGLSCHNSSYFFSKKKRLTRSMVASSASSGACPVFSTTI